MQSVPQFLSSRLTLWIGSVRDGFVVLMPLTFFGVAATLIGNFPIPAGRAWLDTTFGPGWTAATDGVVQSTWGMFGLALAVVLASVVARRLPLADGDAVLPPIWSVISALANPTCAEIVRTISSLGRSQRAEVVAEFVETAEQRDRLLELGCDVFQGYLHSPPLPPVACLDYLLARLPAGAALAGDRARQLTSA